jgi:phosphoglycerate kinase
MDINNFNFEGKKVLIRVDFNVPMDKDRQVTDDTRLRGAIPTIKHVLNVGGAVVLMSHLDRPLKKLLEDGSIDRNKYTLRNVVKPLSDLLGVDVKFCDETVGEKAQKMSEDLRPGEVLLLENTRFYAGEEKGDETLAKGMAALGDFYINDAFGAAHRAHSSTTVVAHYFDKDHKCFGYLMKAELDHAKKLTDNPERPFVAVTGGAKVSDKILILEKLLGEVDHLIIGGGMAYTFIKAQGGSVGNSLVEEDRISTALELLEKAKKLGVKIHLPIDSIVADAFDNAANTQMLKSDQIPSGWMGLDIGRDAIIAFVAVIKEAKTILWNGPMGVFEMPNFAQGTHAIAQAIADRTKEGAFSLIGGGDSAAAVNQMGLGDDVSFVSTGGGAMLELLEGKELPGVAAVMSLD